MIATRFNPLGIAKDYGDATVIEVTVTDDDTSFAFGRYTGYGYSVSGLQGHTEFTVDWGDGTSDTYTGLQYHNNNSQIYPQHTYLKGGKYIMTISNDLECFNFYGNLKVTRLIQWGADVTYGCHYSYRAAEMMSTFADCTNLVGPLPPWPPKMIAMVATFWGCSNLDSHVPEWNDVVTEAQSCYRDCPKLGGLIPRWGKSLKNVYACYYRDTSLAGVWEGATDEELMPSHITTTGACVTGTNLRDYFYTTWGGSRAVPTE